MDFIAVAGRHLDEGLLGLRYNHYSIQYWLTCGNAAPEGEMEKRLWLFENPFSRKVRSVELQRDAGWRVWARLPGDGFWTRVSVAISVIQFRDRGARFVSIFTGPPATVRARWRVIERLAGNYEYAEQEAFNGQFRHWPNSKYGTPFDGPFNNSNTFVRDIVRRAGLQMRELGGSYPGNNSPEDVPDIYGGQLPFRGEGPGGRQIIRIETTRIVYASISGSLNLVYGGSLWLLDRLWYEVDHREHCRGNWRLDYWTD